MLDGLLGLRTGKPCLQAAPPLRMMNLSVLAWDKGGHGTQRAFAAKCARTRNPSTRIATMPTGELLIVKGNPCLAMLTEVGKRLGRFILL